MGRARRTARGSRADVGLARGTPGGSWHARSGANLGITAASICSSSTGGRPKLGRTAARGYGPAAGASRPELGRAPSGSARARLGWSSRAATARTVRSAACTRAHPATCAAGCASPGGGALMELTCGSPRSGVGRSGRFAAIPDSDGAVVEPTGSGVEPPGACGLGSGRTRLRGLGCAPGRGRATTDGGTFVECPGARGLGRAENRGAGRSPRALMVCAARVARRAGCGTAAMEHAGAARCTAARSVVSARTGARRAGAFRAPACPRADRRGAGRRSRSGAG